MCERCEKLEDALQQILLWSEAYPIDVFLEPTKEQFRRAHELLRTEGMTLDAFGASIGRHSLMGVGRIARKALDG